MAENRSVSESLSVEHLPLWQLRQHLIDVTVELADELVLEGNPDRLLALTRLYQTTLDALQHRDPRAAR